MENDHRLTGCPIPGSIEEVDIQVCRFHHIQQPGQAAHTVADLHGQHRCQFRQIPRLCQGAAGQTVIVGENPHGTELPVLIGDESPQINTGLCEGTHQSPQGTLSVFRVNRNLLDHAGLPPFMLRKFFSIVRPSGVRIDSG